MNTAVNNSTQSPTPSVSVGAPLKPIKKNKLPLAYILGGLLLLLLIIGGGVAFMLSKQKQDIRQQASGGEDVYSCGGYPTAQLCGQESGGKCTWSNNACKPVEAPTGPGDGQFTHLDGCDGTVCNDDDGCSCSMDCNTKFPKKGETCGGTKPEVLNCGQYSSAQMCGQEGQGKCTWSGNSCIAAGVNPGNGGCNNLAEAICNNTSGCSYTNGACSATNGDSCGGLAISCQAGSCSQTDQVSGNASGRCGAGNKMYCCKTVTVLNCSQYSSAQLCGQGGQGKCTWTNNSCVAATVGSCTSSAQCTHAPYTTCNSSGKCQGTIEGWTK
jgi:hypothetical protein